VSTNMPTRSPATAGGRGGTASKITVPKPVDLTDYDIRATAFDKYHRKQGSKFVTEIDRYNDVLRREQGAWVMALVWVGYEEVREAQQDDEFTVAGRWDDVEPKYQPKNYKTLLNPKDRETKDGHTEEPDVSEA